MADRNSPERCTVCRGSWGDNPFEMEPCRHVLCRTCARILLEGRKKCPRCQLNVADIRERSGDAAVAPAGVKAEEESSTPPDKFDLRDMCFEIGGGELVAAKKSEVYRRLQQCRDGGWRTLILSGCGNEVRDLTSLSSLVPLEMLSLDSCEDVPRGLQDVVALPNLRTLSLKQMRVDDACLSMLRRSKCLTVLCCEGCAGITDASPIGAILSIQDLSLGGCVNIRKGLEEVCTLPNLKRLNLSKTRASNNCLENLKGNNSVEILNLSGCGAITDVSPLGEVTSLRVLSLTGCVNIEQGLGEVCSHSDLTSLDLNGTKAEDFCLRKLAEVKSITTLKLSGCPKVTDVSPLGELTALEELSLYFCRGVNKGLRDVCRVSSLKKVWISHVEVRNECLEDMRENKEMTVLDIGWCKSITDVSALGEMSGLEELCLCECVNITKGLDKVCALSKLRMLNLHSTAVTDGCLECLRGSGCLADLNLSECLHVTDVTPVGGIPSLEKLSLKGCVNIKAGLEVVCTVRSLKELNVGETNLTDLCVDALRLNTNLTVLSLRGCKDVKDVSPIGDLVLLEELSLSLCTGITRGLEKVCGLPTLKKLDLRATNVADECLVELKRGGNLTKLSLQDCACVTDVSPIAEMASLEDLNLCGCGGLQRGVELLFTLPNFQLDWVSKSQITDECLVQLRRRENITSVDLSFCLRITDVSPLGEMTWLQCLSLHGCANIKNGLEVVFRLPNFKVGWVGREQITDQCLATMAERCREPSLDLRGCSNLTDVTPLTMMDSLQHLNLSACKNINKGVERVLRLPNLKTLIINKDKVTNQCLHSLMAKNVTMLDISGCLRVTDLTPISVLASLTRLNLAGCRNLETGYNALTHLKELKVLHIWGVAIPQDIIHKLVATSVDVKNAAPKFPESPAGPLYILSPV